ncbi:MULTISPECIES: NUDIX hydrolase [Streptomyces]|uniref:NUDIX hydrolase n=1 Tax=Streptomyces TaxID=1883 RepID=UPI00324FD76E|nr:NUDIX domain-containing protein [Streptomyces sp. NBC_01136]
MDVVDQWTGRHATALQFALRMSHDELASRLGVARRTVAAWHEKADTILRNELQQALDTLFEQAPQSAKVRFARRLQEADADDIETAKEAAVRLTAAIAVVLHETSVLLVCRRDSEPSGISWQFPAGIVKPGAAAANTAVRETLAETGVHCKIRESLGDRIHPLSKVRCEYFLCDYLTGGAENRDEEENISVLWSPAKDVTNFIATDTIFPPVLRVLKGLT